MPPFFSGNNQNSDQVSPLFQINYWLGFSFCFVIFASLFIFRRFYSKLSRYRVFTISLGIIQFFLFITYFLFHQLNGDITWKDYFPFQLCTILDFLVTLLLFFPNNKIFNYTFFWVGPVILSFLLPDPEKRVFGLDRFFYYSYYLHHLIIVFGYFYLYLYGHVKFEDKYIKQSAITLVVFGLAGFGLNFILKTTNYFFLGNDGFKAAMGSIALDTSQWNPGLRFLFMFSIAMFFLFSFYFLLHIVKPFYSNYGRNRIFFNENKFNKFIEKKKHKYESIQLIHKENEVKLWKERTNK